MRALLIGALCLSPIVCAAESRFAPEQAALLQQGLIATAEAFIAPAYADHAEATRDLADALDRYCDAGAEADIAPARRAFETVFLSWQRASIVQVGPIMDAEGPMRVQLWPDPKGFARRAVRNALREADPSLVADGGLTGRSIALTNLTALEYILFGAPPEGYACDLAQAIGAFQADLAASVASAWAADSPFRADYDTAVDGNARYPFVDVLIREFLAGGVVYSDRLRKFKLQRGLGAEPGDARPERTEARLSGLGLKSIETSFRAFSSLYMTPFGLFEVSMEIGGSPEFFILAQTADNIADALSIQSQTLSEIADEDGAAAAELRRFAELVLFHEDYLKVQFPSSIGLTTGFTSADGD